MRKLEDIPKHKPSFKVPDGYFDQLPGVVQARMTKKDSVSSTSASRALSFSLKYALPVLALIAAGIFWLRPAAPAEDQLDDVDTEQIALYLNTTDHLDDDEFNETTDFTREEVDQLEDTIYSNIEYSNEDILDIDLDNL